MSFLQNTALLLLLCALLAPYSTQSAPIGLPASTSEDTAPNSVCYSFKEPEWQFHRSKRKFRLPRIERPGELLLIPDNTFDAGVAAVLTGKAKPPFEATFEYSTWDDDGSTWAVWNSADGFSFFFLKDASGYGRPPTGGTLGLKPGGGGYALSFSLYGYRLAQLTAPSGTVLQRIHFDRAYSDRKWVLVKVTVTDELISIMANQQLILEQPVQLGVAANDLGFSAASGAADAEQKIRNFCLRQLPLTTEETSTGNTDTVEAVPESTDAPDIDIESDQGEAG
ncbi:MAG: hypothetical protein ACR2PT_01550 [Endozoicomonas sp.]